MTPYIANMLAEVKRIPLDRDFHSLDAATVERIIAAADDYGYRAPKNANGSRARYFHALLVRRANQGSK